MAAGRPAPPQRICAYSIVRHGIAPSDPSVRADTTEPASPFLQMALAIARRLAEEMAPDLARQMSSIIVNAILRVGVGAHGTDPEFVSARTAGKIAEVHPASIRRLVNAGKLRRYTYESEMRINVAELRAYLGRPSVTGADTVAEKARAITARLK